MGPDSEMNAGLFFFGWYHNETLTLNNKMI